MINVMMSISVGTVSGGSISVMVMIHGLIHAAMVWLENVSDRVDVAPLRVIWGELGPIAEMNQGFDVVREGVFHSGGFVLRVCDVTNVGGLIESFPSLLLPLII